MSIYRKSYCSENREEIIQKYGLDISIPEEFNAYCDIQMKELLDILPEDEREKLEERIKNET